MNTVTTAQVMIIFGIGIMNSTTSEQVIMPDNYNLHTTHY